MMIKNIKLKITEVANIKSVSVRDISRLLASILFSPGSPDIVDLNKQG